MSKKFLKFKVFVLVISFILVLGATSPILKATDNKKEKSSIEKAADTATCIMAGQVVEKIVGSSPAKILAKPANAATVGTCTVILDNKEKIASTLKEIPKHLVVDPKHPIPYGTTKM